jgi:hypothetical protein
MPAKILSLCVFVVLVQSAGAQLSRQTSRSALLPPEVQTAELTASDGQAGSYLGTSVAISGDTVVVGAPGVRSISEVVPGAAYVYVKPSSGWENMTQVAKLTASDNGANDGFGNRVAISGNVIVVNSNLPELYVFVEPAGGWTDMTETAILSAPSVGLAPCLCAGVAIDGDNIVVGSPLDGIGNYGSIEVFTKPAKGGWKSASEPSAVLMEAGALYESQSFDSVAISGKTVVGEGFAQNGTTGQYSVFLFTEPETGWNGDYTPQAVLSSTQPLDYFRAGQVAINATGDTVVAGSPSPNLTFFPAGFVDVWVEPASGWSGVDMTETAQLSDGNTTFADEFGIATAITGNEIIVGTPQAIQIKAGEAYRGAAYVYVKPASGWQTITKYNSVLVSSDWTANDGFGSALVAAGPTTVVTEPYGPKEGDVGSAYVFQK